MRKFGYDVSKLEPVDTLWIEGGVRNRTPVHGSVMNSSFVWTNESRMGEADVFDYVTAMIYDVMESTDDDATDEFRQRHLSFFAESPFREM